MQVVLRVGAGIVLSAALLPASNVMDEIRQGSFSSQTHSGKELKLLDWNIDRGTRLEKITSGITSIEPDLAILQEVDLNARRSQRLDVAEELAKTLKMNFVFGPEFQELGQGSTDKPAFHGQALLTSLPIRSTRMIRFQAQSGFWKPQPYLPKWGLFQRRLGGRMALIAELDFNGRTLVVYDLHLESRSGGDIQYAQLKEVLADTARYPADTPILIAGDLNTKYHHSTITIVDELKRAGYENAFGSREERTHVIVGSLDYIFAKGPVRISEGRVHREMHGSDHFAVSARLTDGAGVAR